MHSLIAGIANSFTDNLIAEQRYRMILDGLQVTLLITFCAAVLGTLLGGVVCWARMSRKPWLRQTAKIYIDLMRGTPVLVLLMLMYYVFMAPLGTTGITVAVVTFAMNASAYIGEMLLTVRTPHPIPSDALDIEDNMLAAAILRSVSTDIHIDKNALIITVR